ncbi:YaiI/YqxD family protein [Bacillus xiapuensis]|uniref:YaiI/YqxD family protein n=1 Tax=Bacillus xiapuensis TaxID=2014075 RepID=UPI000C237E29|nr:YaiI/YqxD family protein [Bacillus xiapuensis]
MTKILIDADGCPVVDETCQAAEMFQLPVLLICDTAHLITREGVQTLTVSKGADAADFAIVNRVEKGDIVVTQDYGLAAMVLAKQGHAIDQNGRLYTAGNIDQLLHSRHTAKKIRQAGGRLKGPKKRNKENDRLFLEKITALCRQVCKRA